MATAIATHQIGKVVQVIGPVLDVEFESGHLPELYNALTIDATTDSGQTIHVTVEVQQHIGRNQVRAVAMSSTEGMTRGMTATDTGKPIAVPDWVESSPGRVDYLWYCRACDYRFEAVAYFADQKSEPEPIAA